ncbi:heterotrimeric G-protein alpha subunit, GPA1-like protein [Roridomyces roridus]|uniref:Heterotrimeric G-protein alpha subunit, GPA1-like protein n=1 Tax=Roridomyces roridus TaxID=1738132 RepID=A0AAD7BQU1_9AGAR|nr:heterotrimeric G-protein alpha subunit, GPA1-like protein [Roridomyces roridus]
MGCINSLPAGEAEAKARNDAIEATLKRDRAQMRHEIKMLLLGAGDSGKSTVLKQFRLIHLNGYNAAEKEAYREIVFSNTMQGMRAILDALPDLKLTLLPSSEEHKTTVFAFPTVLEADVMPRELAQAFKALWADPAVKQAVLRSREFQLLDSAEYYLGSIDRLSAPDYVPTDQDILRSRVKTTGITETVFTIGELTYKLYDVGGQRSERRKWVHCFENVAALVFLVGLSEYDQCLSEDRTVNRMHEALTLFESICNSRWFARSSIIVFMNKIDLLREKVERSPIATYFSDYQGGPSYDAACEFFLKKFTSLNRRGDKKQIFTHLTCATDTKQIKFVLDAVQDILLKLHIKEAGLM